MSTQEPSCEILLSWRAAVCGCLTVLLSQHNRKNNGAVGLYMFKNIPMLRYNYVNPL